ncbi:hypothetical protein Agub_g11143 [Astrephomene gubernaculifera]|uniref:Uncharacterized protein n=1 Tax=Astrephomene gubernaculifera TaxID=47775 RepID=A0AAD3DY56_9CHLO|nr:hypothetical protein Agub_g11143 [Astrephomene gubernaculifera]
MPAADFEAIFAELIANSSIPCEMKAGAAPVDLQLDRDRNPADKLTCAAMMALDALSREATDPNVQWFATLYALHLRATDMDFEDLLGFGPLASMAAAALEAWTVEDGFLMASACEAQDRLAEVLEWKLTRPAYQPPWVHPFQFLSDEYSDELFDEEVKVCALAFVGDEDLKEKVKKAAKDLFELLASDPHRVMIKSTLQHRGVTFRIECAKGKGAPPPADAYHKT